MSRTTTIDGSEKLGRKRIATLVILFVIVSLIGIPAAANTGPLSVNTTNLSCDNSFLVAPPGESGGGSDWQPFLEDTQTKSWMEIDRLHSLGWDGDGITIAIIDSGLYPHSYFTNDLHTQLVQYVCVNDDYSLSKTTSWSSPLLQDHVGHGTEMAGVALQFAPKARLVFYATVRYQEGKGWRLDWDKVNRSLADLDANYATYGVNVLSMSIGNSKVPQRNYELAMSIQTYLSSLASKGVTIFISSGNDYDKPVSWPARIAPDFDGIFSVGAVFDQEYQNYGKDFDKPGRPRHAGQIWFEEKKKGSTKWKGTSHRDGLEIMASGVDIMTTTNENGGNYHCTGTSPAAPMAAGCLACLLELWHSIEGFATIPEDFIEGIIENTAEYRFASDPHLYGYGIVSPYDCRIYPLSVAASSVHTGYLLTSYDAEFYGHGFSVYLEWWERNGRTWVKHSDLVYMTSYGDWDPVHAQNSIHPAFYEGYYATIKWRYKMSVFGLSMTLYTSWHTDTVPGGYPE